MENIITTIPLGDVVSIIIRTLGIFLYAFLLLRLLGRRKLSHIGYIDLLLIIAFGSAVGDVMIYKDSIAHFWASVVAITVVAVIVKILDEISSHSKFGYKILEGEVVLFIDNGKIVDGILEKENLTEEKITSWLRQKDVKSINEVKKAFIESDGEISIILKKKKK